MKLILISLLVLTVNNCRHYFLRDAAKYNLTQEEENILKSKKIGVVGFHPFYDYPDQYYDNSQILSRNLVKALQFIYEKNDSEQIPFDPNHFLTGQGKTRRDQRLSMERTVGEYSKFQTKLEKSNIVKPDKSISENNLRIFLKTYLDKARHLGHQEILDLLDFSDKNKIYLKENDFDYWIVGFHAERKSEFSLEGMLTFFPSLYTLGFFPFFDHDDIKSSFWIFDKKLNLLKEIEFENKYVVYVTASWVIWKSEDNFIFNGGRPIDVYEPDIKEFQKELVKFLQNQAH